MSELDRRLRRLEDQQDRLQAQIAELRELIDPGTLTVETEAPPEPDPRWDESAPQVPSAPIYDDEVEEAEEPLVYRPITPDPMWREVGSPRSLDELATPRNLAVVGGTGVTIGLAFLVSYGISQGWITEGMRVAVGAIASILLAAAGAWLLERREGGAPAMALLLSGLIGGYFTILAATRLYELVDTDVGVVLATLVGAVAMTAALRWNAEAFAVLASLGALIAPVLVGAEYTTETLAFLLPVFAIAMGVSALRSWHVLFAVSLFVTLASLAGVQTNDPLTESGGFLVMLAISLLAFAGLLARPFSSGESDEWTAALYGLAASALAVTGFLLLDDAATSFNSSDDARSIWLFTFAAINAGFVFRAHALGLVDLRRAALTAATAAFAWGLGDVLHGPALVISWSAAAIVTLVAAREDWELLIAAGFASLAAGHVLVNEIPPDALGDGVDSLGDAWIAGLALIAVAAAAWAYGIRAGHRVAALVAVALGIYLLSVTIVDVSVNDSTPGFVPVETTALDDEAKGQVAVSCLWALCGLGFVLAGLRWRITTWRSAGLGLLALAGAKIVIFDLSSLSVAARTISFIVVGLIFLLAAFAYQVVARRTSEDGIEGG